MFDFNLASDEIETSPPTVRSLLKLVVFAFTEIVSSVPFDIVSPFPKFMSFPVTVKSPKVVTLDPESVIAVALDDDISFPVIDKSPASVVFPLKSTLKASDLLEPSIPFPITKAGADVENEFALVAEEPEELY